MPKVGVACGTWGASSHRYLLVIEGDGEANYSAYSPDVAGVAAAEATREKCERLMREASEFHLEGAAAEGEPLPEPHSTASYAVVDVDWPPREPKRS